MEPVQRKQDVTGHDQSRRTTARSKRSQGIVARHVGMNNLYFVLSHNLRKAASTLRVKRVSQRECREALARQKIQLLDQCGVWSERNVNVVTPGDQSFREIRKMAFTAPERLG